ncbi:MAG: alpha/beta hydrolase [Thermoanaerobaculia bacterium]
MGELLRLVAVLSLALLAACSMRSLLYPVPPIAVPQTPPAPFEEVYLESAQDERIHAWHAAGKRELGPVVVLLHGNGENLATMAAAGTLEQARAISGAVLAPDYPGYGRSGGRPSEESLVAAAEASAAWLASRHPRRPLVLAGWSLGAAVAVLVAADRDDVAGLVLLSAWTRLDEVAREHFAGWMVRWFLRESYDSLGRAPGIDVPVLAIHGESDGIVPVGLGRRLAEGFPGGARWVALPGVGHNDLLAQPEVWREIEQFLTGLPATARLGGSP